MWGGEDRAYEGCVFGWFTIACPGHFTPPWSFSGGWSVDANPPVLHTHTPSHLFLVTPQQQTLWTGIAMLLLAVPALAAVFVIPCCTRRVKALRRSMSYRELRTLDPDALIIPDTSAAASINT